MRSRLGAWVVAIGVLAAPCGAGAQLSNPCDLECGLVLGATSFVFASGTATAVGRMNGGFTSTRDGIVAWTAGFVAALGGGILLAGNGERQEQAVYAAGVGAAAGAVVGLATESLLGDSTGATRLAATLIGAAAGALTGGVYGALSWDEELVGAPADPVPFMTVSVPLGF